MLDLWLATVVTQHGQGAACLIRYADAFVCAFEAHAAAERCSSVRGQRLAQCGLELSGAKTRVLPCRRHRQAGKTRCALLGCAWRWGKDRKGRDHLKRRTARKNRRASRTRLTAWGKENRHLRLPALFTRLPATLRGYANDDGVQGNAASLQEFCNKAMRM